MNDTKIHSLKLAERYKNTVNMSAIGITDYPEIGKVPDHLKMLSVPTPRPSANEVVVKLCASAMHIDEIYAAQGTALGRFYGPKNVSEDNPALLGSCATGQVVGLGKGTSKFEIGDDVIIIPSEHPQSGSWATYQCFGEQWLMHKPAELSHVEAAAVTMAACVAWGAIGFAKVKSGDRCAVVGASGSIGVMVLQFLKSLDCHVTAVCSGASVKFVREHGADEVVDYTQSDFGDVTNEDEKYDVVFDCVGGRQIEDSAFRSLKRSGTFETVVGPKQYIGEEKLSWLEFLGVMGHIVWRMIFTRIGKGPKYTFGEKYPRLIIHDAMRQLLEHDIRMPVSKTIPFDIDAVINAVRSITKHREKGRVVIDFNLTE